MISEEAAALLREEKYDFTALVRIMALLRSEDGCPWDRLQTHASIRSNLIEETYEVVEAIDKEDAPLLCEELGDLLLQVVFHARMSEEAGDFSIDDVISGVCLKLIRRHPHIFASAQADGAEAVLEAWEKIKTEEKQRRGTAGSLAAIPPSLPALMRAQKCVKKAAQAGIGESTETLVGACAEQADKLYAAVRAGDTEDAARRIGEMVFCAAAAAQSMGLDCEEILSHRCESFIRTVSDEEKNRGDFSALTDESRAEIANYAFLLKNSENMSYKIPENT